MNKVFYLCNGQKEDCSKRTCYLNGGRCRHTSNVKYAKNFEKKNPSEEAAYWEKETDADCETASKN